MWGLVWGVLVEVGERMSVEGGPRVARLWVPGGPDRRVVQPLGELGHEHPTEHPHGSLVELGCGRAGCRADAHRVQSEPRIGAHDGVKGLVTGCPAVGWTTALSPTERS